MPSDRGLLAWDVHRLIELARELPIIRIDPDRIAELDEIYWFDDEHQRPTCRTVIMHAELIREVDLAYPVILGADGRVMDGMHRVAKAVLEHIPQIDARRFECDPEPDYVGVAPADLPY